MCRYYLKVDPLWVDPVARIIKIKSRGRLGNGALFLDDETLNRALSAILAHTWHHGKDDEKDAGDADDASASASAPADDVDEAKGDVRPSAREAARVLEALESELASAVADEAEEPPKAYAEYTRYCFCASGTLVDQEYFVELLARLAVPRTLSKALAYTTMLRIGVSEKIIAHNLISSRVPSTLGRSLALLQRCSLIFGRDQPGVPDEDTRRRFLDRNLGLPDHVTKSDTSLH